MGSKKDKRRTDESIEDPLPLILDMPSEGAAAQGAKTVRGYQKRQSQKTMDERIKAANDW